MMPMKCSPKTVQKLSPLKPSRVPWLFSTAQYFEVSGQRLGLERGLEQVSAQELVRELVLLS
jgi:hypothetical protein